MTGIQERYMQAAMEKRALESQDFRDARIERAKACLASGKHLAEKFSPNEDWEPQWCAVCGFMSLDFPRPQVSFPNGVEQ